MIGTLIIETRKQSQWWPKSSPEHYQLDIDPVRIIIRGPIDLLLTARNQLDEMLSKSIDSFEWRFPLPDDYANNSSINH